MPRGEDIFGAPEGIYKPQYGFESGPRPFSLGGPVQTHSVNVAGQSPQDALQQAQYLTKQGGPGSSYSVGPSGEVATNVQGADPFAGRLSALSQAGMLPPSRRGGMPSGGGGGVSAGGGAPKSGGGDGAASARDAAFARAKDRAGMVAQSGVKSLQNIMSARGLQGSTIEASGLQDQFTGATNEMGDMLREQAIQESQRADQVSDRDYGGDLTMRGQDMSQDLAQQQLQQQEQQALISLINAVGAY